MNTIKLDRSRIIERIEAGDNCNGNYVLATDGTDYGIYWADKNRFWDSWPDSYGFIIEIPALDPEGSGEASEDAADMLCAIFSDAEFQAVEKRHESGDIGWIELAEELAPEDWEYNRQASAEWLAEAFLAACNGDGGDLNQPNPWGCQWIDDDIVYFDPPAEFEWARTENQIEIVHVTPEHIGDVM
jgi:hypothetical protein